MLNFLKKRNALSPKIVVPATVGIRPSGQMLAAEPSTPEELTYWHAEDELARLAALARDGQC
ncbi:MAG: hypothetical protein CMP09_10005 [Yangia sp.]|nr:hypothetical protein [Salipiger sp.]